MRATAPAPHGSPRGLSRRRFQRQKNNYGCGTQPWTPGPATRTRSTCTAPHGSIKNLSRNRREPARFHQPAQRPVDVRADYDRLVPESIIFACACPTPITARRDRRACRVFPLQEQGERRPRGSDASTGPGLYRHIRRSIHQWLFSGSITAMPHLTIPHLEFRTENTASF